METDWGRMENKSLTDHMSDLIEFHYQYRVRMLALEAVAVAARQYLKFPDRAFPEVRDALRDALEELETLTVVHPSN